MSFENVTQPGYIDLLARRLHEHVPLTWLQQSRDLLEQDLAGAKTILDVGCATGYAAKVFPELQYLGIDVEDRYLEIARRHFHGDPRVSFASHDINRDPAPRADIVLLNAVLEHCPSLSPALDNLLESANNIVLIRAWLGEHEQIHTIPAPKSEFAASVRKFSNQYAFIDVFRALQRHGFDGKLVRDRYTESLPYFVDEVMRTFFFVKATRRL
jgi:SAM-dependent methyltransferase